MGSTIHEQNFGLEKATESCALNEVITSTSSILIPSNK